MSAAKQKQLARELDTRVRYLRLPDLRFYAGLLTGIAQGIQDGTIQVPK